MPINRFCNPLTTKSFLDNESPSVKAGLKNEKDFRFYGSYLITLMTKLLKMTQKASATGQIIFHQFYCQKSFLSIPLLDAAMACILVSGKVEECYRRVRDIVNVGHFVHCKIRKTEYQPFEYVSDDYYNWRDRVTHVEIIILRELGFHVQPKHATGLLLNYLQSLDLIDLPKSSISQSSYNYLNDALRGSLYILHDPATLACASIDLACEDHSMELPKEDSDWFLVFDVKNEDLASCKSQIRRLYLEKIDHLLPLIPLELSVFSETILTRQKQEEKEKEREREGNNKDERNE